MLVFSILMLSKTLKSIHQHMHNLKANFDTFLAHVTQFANTMVNSKGNIPRVGVIPKFSNLEVIALSLMAEALSIDSESLLFEKLKEYTSDFPNLISRCHYNQRRRKLSQLTNAIRHNIAKHIDGGEDYFVVDSKPLPVCRNARAGRVKKRAQGEITPNFGYCAAQGQHYFGYKMHLTSGLSGVIHTFTLSQASVADIHYLQHVKFHIQHSTLIGDRGYLSATVQLDLFQSAAIRLEVPMRNNQKGFKPAHKPFSKARKRIETTLSQLNDQFMLIRNYAKNFDGFSTRILAKITAFTVLQLINSLKNNPLSKTKYALA